MYINLSFIFLRIKFQSHLRVGKVHAAMGNFEKAVQAFGNSCNELDDSPANFNIRLEILEELSNSAPKNMELGEF